MKEKIKIEAYVSYQKDFLRIEELGGINELIFKVINYLNYTKKEEYHEGKY